MKIIGQELAVIREHLGLSVGDIQHRTKLSKDVIESIENGVIFDRKNEKDVYLRTYIRSFARALKIDDAVVVKALDQLKAGNYNHLLLDYYPDLNRAAVDKKHITDGRNDRSMDAGRGQTFGSSSVSGSSGGGRSGTGDSTASGGGSATGSVAGGSGGGAEGSEDSGVAAGASGIASGGGTASGNSGRAGSEASASTRNIKMNDSQRSPMLPGDEAGKEINWAQMGKQFNQPPKKFSWKKMFGWIVFVAAILASLYLFFTLL